MALKIHAALLAALAALSGAPVSAAQFGVEFGLGLTPRAPGKDLSELNLTLWRVDSIKGRAVTTESYFDIADGILTVMNGCSIGFEPTSRDTFRVRMMQSPTPAQRLRPGCADSYAFADALLASANYRLSGDKLEFLDSGGSLTLTLSRPTNGLVNHRWRVVAYREGDALREVPSEFVAEPLIALGFIMGPSGCGNFGSRYTLDGDRVAFDPLFLESRLCLPQDTRMASCIGDAIGRVVAFRPRDARMELLNRDGQVEVVLAPPPVERPSAAPTLTLDTASAAYVDCHGEPLPPLPYHPPLRNLGEGRTLVVPAP